MELWKFLGLGKLDQYRKSNCCVFVSPIEFPVFSLKALVFRWQQADYSNCSNPDRISCRDLLGRELGQT